MPYLRHCTMRIHNTSDTKWGGGGVLNLNTQDMMGTKITTNRGIMDGETGEIKVKIGET